MTDSTPPTIEKDGRLIVLKPHEVLIQSEAGQRHLIERHEEVMAHLDAYPNLRKHLFNDKWATRFIKDWLASTETLALFSYPAFYLEPYQLKIGIYPGDYLARADAAVGFLAAKAPKRNRNDLFGNLLKSNSAAAAFEVMLAWALLQHFGEGAVEPYPRVADEGDRNVDFAVVRDGARVLIEATILLDDPGRGAAKRYAIASGIGSTIEGGSDGSDVHRLLLSCYDKVHERTVKHPLILCVNQCATWPDPASGTEATGRLLAREIWANDPKLVGIAYFYSGNLVSTCFAEARFRTTNADAALVNNIRTALGRLASQAQVDAARGESKPKDG